MTTGGGGDAWGAGGGAGDGTTGVGAAAAGGVASGRDTVSLPVGDVVVLPLSQATRARPLETVMARRPTSHGLLLHFMSFSSFRSRIRSDPDPIYQVIVKEMGLLACHL